jgi:hypothetical protein
MGTRCLPSGPSTSRSASARIRRGLGNYRGPRGRGTKTTVPVVPSDLRPRPSRVSKHVLDRPGGDDPLGGDAEPLGTLAAVGLHVDLAGRVGVGVDREQAPELQGERQQVIGWVAAFGRLLISTAVPCSAQASNTARASKSDWAGCRASPRRAARCSDRARSPAGSTPRPPCAPSWGPVHPQLAVHGCRDEVEPGEHRVGLVQAPVVEDVDLDALEQPERPTERAVDGLDDADLLGEPLGAEPVRDRSWGCGR